MSRSKGQKTPYKTPIDQLKAALREQITKQVHRSVARKMSGLKKRISDMENQFRKAGE